MSWFLEDAARILETAAAAPAEASHADLSILIDAAGGIRVLETGGWHPEALRTHYGARALYQVIRSPETVTVRAQCGLRRCTLEEERPATVARRLLGRGLLPQSRRSTVGIFPRSVA